MDIFWTLVIGLSSGVLVHLITLKRQPGSILTSQLLGIAGAYVGSWIGRVLGLFDVGKNTGYLLTVLGAILVLVICRAVMVVSLRHSNS